MLDLSPSPSHDANHALDSGAERNQGETVVTVLWRYKWLIGILLPVGAIFGYWVNCQKPITYRATAKLMFKSDTPLTLDASTGVVTGGIPSGSLMQSLITSDAIAGRVSLTESQRTSDYLRGLSDEEFVTLVRGGIRFQTITSLKDARDRMIAAINFDGQDPEVCVAAVEATSRAIGEHFREEREAKINEFGRLIGRAQDKLLPQQAELEKRYQEFRDQAPLEWDPKGLVVNPHRQRQLQLQSFRDQLERQIRDLDCELRFAKGMKARHENPLMAALILGQLSDVFKDSRLMLANVPSEQLVSSDLELQQIEVEKELIPLMIKREQLEVAYGSEHPEVKSVVAQIEKSQSRLNELIAQSTNRRRELSTESQLMGDGEGYRSAQIERAREAVQAYTQGLVDRLSVAQEDVQKLDLQIETEKQRADELKKYEDTDASFRRQIAGVQGMLIQLEQQLAALELVDTNGGIMVEQLVETGRAYPTGPDLKKDIVLFGLLGLGISGLLAILCEASAKTFRSAESIQMELHSPVLAHIPVDERKRRNSKRTLDPTLRRLDSKLAVVHRPYSPAAEAVRAVRTAVLLDRRQNDGKVFQITSPLPGDGKSTLAANVGCSIAQSGKKTLIIDLDLRSPRLSLRFNLDSRYGLANVLNGELTPDQAVHQTPVENLDVLPCGPLPANPAEALTLAELGEVFQWAREHYDFVIVDTPPLLMVSDPAIVTTHVDAAILVMRIRRRCRPNAKEAAAMLRWSGTRVMGIVINKFSFSGGIAAYKSTASGSYQSLGYGYGDKYRRRYQREVNARDTYVVTGATGKNRIDSGQEEHAVVPSRPHLSRPQVKG